MAFKMPALIRGDQRKAPEHESTDQHQPERTPRKEKDQRVLPDWDRFWSELQETLGHQHRTAN